MKKIGLTGGIGSGKTYVAQILEKMGYPVYYSDTRAKELCNEDPLIIRELKKLLGDDAYKNKKLNKSFISNQIFSSPDLRESINSIIHPVVRNDFDQWLKITTRIQWFLMKLPYYLRQNLTNDSMKQF